METTKPVVNIRRSGNILEVDPGRVDILGPQLTYAHNSMSQCYDWTAKKREMKIIDKELYRINEGKLYTLQGALQRVVQALTAAGCECLVQDLRVKTVLEPDYEWFAKCMPDLEFRLKQDEILATLIGNDCGQIVAPTAYGKTFIMLALATLYPKAWIIMASPSTSLLGGTYRRLLKFTAKVGRVGGGHNERQQITLCTYQSIMNAPIDKCDILVLDECHKCSAPVISSNIAKIRSPVKIFGMTATPTGRSDNAHLPIEVMVGPVIANIEYDEAAEAGLIAPLKVAFIEMPEGSCNTFGYNYATKPAKKRNVYWRNDVRNAALADAVRTWPARLGMGTDPQTLVLAETTEHAFRMAQLLPGFEVVYANMASDRLDKLKALGLVPQDYRPLTRVQRESMLQQFEAGTLRRVISTGCWGEGVDFVNLDVVCNVSGSPSAITTIQWSGRNSRKHEGKTFGLIIDSLDKWDTWANGRAKLRIREYKKKKWELLKGITDGVNKTSG